MQMRQSWLALLLLGPYLSSTQMACAALDLYFTPEWSDRLPQAKAIAGALSKSSGLDIQAHIARSYPELIEVFATDQPVPFMPVLAYAGSFAQAILHARNASVPIVQGINGKELYTGVLIAPAAAGTDPQSIMAACGGAVAYARGASSGESAAKAATGGQAHVAVPSHAAALEAIKANEAKCAFVKDWWWEANKQKYPGMSRFDYPGVSDHKNPDNVLSANRAVSPGEIAKLRAAALGNPEVFGVKSFAAFDPALLQPTLDLMKQAHIDPLTYSWYRAP